jgi:hypothetical protein
MEDSYEITYQMNKLKSELAILEHQVIQKKQEIVQEEKRIVWLRKLEKDAKIGEEKRKLRLRAINDFKHKYDRANI